MANENDAKRDQKLTFLMLSGAGVVLIGGTYALWSWMSTPAPEPSRLDLTRVSVASHSSSSESEAYRQMLKQYNEKGAAAAKEENKSFISSIALDQQAVPVAAGGVKPRVKEEPSSQRRRQSDQGQASGGSSQQDDPRIKALQKLVDRLNPTEDKTPRPHGLQVAEVLGGKNNAGGSDNASAASSYERWAETIPGGGRLQNASVKGAGASGELYSPVEVVPPYWRGAGVIDIGVDSDNSTTPVLGKLSGPYAGAVLKASEGARLAGDGVVIHFTEMAFKGVNYKVDAYALQDDTLLANVATDVDHRYMSRIVLPAILSGVGNISEMYSQANTRVVTNGFSTQTARPDLPDGTAVAGAILGGAAGKAADVLSQDAARTPATQVTVTKGQVVAIQFMRGVYAGDAIAPGRGGERVQSAAPAPEVMPVQPQVPTQPQTMDQWRAQTQMRIEAQRRLQENQ